jgi:menaquinone-dependent protoporphyrinogen IX oxidase
VFALGPVHEDETEFAAAETRVRSVLAKTPELAPVDLAIFGGRIVPDELSFPFSRMPAADIRDWGAIRRWAVRVADSLVPVAVAA